MMDHDVLFMVTQKDGKRCTDKDLACCLILQPCYGFFKIPNVFYKDVLQIESSDIRSWQ